MVEKIKLVEYRGPTSVFVDVEITKEGDLLFSGQDIGDAPKQFFDDSDYEYWMRIPAGEKDRVLLVLIEKLYSGNTSVVSEFRAFLNDKGIPYRFDTF